jgi:hypothetical protein
MTVWYDYRAISEQQAQRIKGLEARVAELESGLIGLLRSRPCGLECNDFGHDKKDFHEGFDCPCKDRWDVAVEAASNLLKHGRPQSRIGHAELNPSGDKLSPVEETPKGDK